MKEGNFKAQIHRCWNIIKQLEMDAEFIPSPYYPESPRAFFKGMSYQDIWKKCLQNRFYHFQLNDNSLISYRFQRPDTFSLSYYEFPYAAASYFDFINSLGFTYYDVGEELMEDYDEYLTTCNVKQSVSPIRYDIDYGNYTEGRHPASHLHIGHESNIRIRTEKIMGPLAFLFFLLRQHYPDKWIQFLQEKESATVEQAVRDSLEEVPRDYINEFDKCEMFLR